MVITHHIAHCCDTTEKEFAASKEINLFIGQSEFYREHTAIKQ